MNILQQKNRLGRVQEEIEAACRQIIGSATGQLAREINRILNDNYDPYNAKAVKLEEIINPPEKRSLLTIADAADEVQMSQAFVKAAIRSGELSVIKMGSHSRVQRTALEQWWLSRRHTKEPERK